MASDENNKEKDKKRRKGSADLERSLKMFIYGETRCEYESKPKVTLKTHKAMIHGIDVVYYECNVGGRIYKAKQQASALKNINLRSTISMFLTTFAMLMDVITRQSKPFISRLIKLIFTILMLYTTHAMLLDVIMKRSTPVI